MFFRRVVRAMVRAILIAMVTLAGLTLLLRGIVSVWAAGHTHTVDETPLRRVAIVFGARIYPDGRPSAMLSDRVAAAADLLRAGKVEVILLTGDNSRLDYDEPGAMREYAIHLGVPEDALVLDYGGRRTYDSCYRARYIFGVTDAVLITQQFHLPRALLTCRSLGIDAVGVAADYQRPNGYSRVSLTYSRLREFPATIVAVMDVLRRPQSPIMGEPLPIFPEEADS